MSMIYNVILRWGLCMCFKTRRGTINVKIF